MSNADLSPPGSSSYTSNTLHVGDGTWDNGRDSFLLPNLVGINFATMQYNGMGNRFRDVPEYHRLITGHGVLAAITFLGVMPLAMWSAKYWRSGGRRAVKLHVYLQILTVVLSTVVLVLGWFAVGPERSLSNPHHGIGVAIYAAIWFQFFYGWLMARLEKRRQAPPTRVPKKAWLHRLLGRAVALLAIVQIALGLTLYGSPKVLFILYAVWVAFLLLAYFALDRYYYEKRPLDYGYDSATDYYSDYGSYISGSRTDYTPGGRPPPSRPPPEQERRGHHWGRDLLAAGGVVGAYELFKHRRSRRREEQEQAELDAERRRRPRPPPAMTPSGATSIPPSSRPSSRPPPPPGVVYGAGGVPSGVSSRLPPGPGRPPPPPDESRMSPDSWEDEKYHPPPAQHTWRDRLLGAGAGIAAFEGVRSLFNRRRRRDDDDDYYDGDSARYRPPLGGSQNMVSPTDVSRVERGHAPVSPSGPGGPPERMNLAGVQPMTPTQTPSRPPRRPRPAGATTDTLSYDDEESLMSPRPGGAAAAAGRRPPRMMRRGDYDDDAASPADHQDHTLRNSIAALGAVAGFREWTRHRREQRERQRAERLRRQELDNEELYNRRNSMNYPRPHDASDRRPSMSGTVMTGVTPEPGFAGSNPELSRTNFGRPDTHHPPLPPGAGTVPSVSGLGEPPSTVGPSVSQQRLPSQAAGGYSIPPPPPGPPPGTAARPADYPPPEPGSLQMPQAPVYPDPSRLVGRENVGPSRGPSGDGDDVEPRRTSAGALFGAAAADLRNGRRRDSQSGSPSRYHGRQESRNRLQKQPARRGSTGSASASQVNTDVPPTAGPSSPPISVRVKMHKDGEHMTFQRLTEEEAEAKRAARRGERRPRRRRGSSQSSMLEDDAPPVSSQRYRRNGGLMRRSSDQPIANVPPPPPLSASAAGGSGRRPSSELNLPPAPPPGPSGPPQPPPHVASPQGMAGLSPPPPPVLGSGVSGSPGDAGTGTDVSAFADNRRRRRAERARRLEAARGAGQRVEFQ